MKIKLMIILVVSYIAGILNQFGDGYDILFFISCILMSLMSCLVIHINEKHGE